MSFIDDEKNTALQLLDELGEVDPEYRERTAKAVEDLGKLGQEALEGEDVEIGLQAFKSSMASLLAALADEKAQMLKGYFAGLSIRVAKFAAGMIVAL